jgi:hypothetical protein
MAYDSTSLALHSAQIGRSHSTGGQYYGGNVWWYKSTADAVATVAGTSYFSDGHKRGMRKYDVVNFMDVGSTLLHIMTVTSVTTGAGATVTTVLSSAT